MASMALGMLRPCVDAWPEDTVNERDQTRGTTKDAAMKTQKSSSPFQDDYIRHQLAARATVQASNG